MTELWQWLVAASWKGSLLLALVLCVIALSREWIAPRWRFALLLLALIRFALPVAPQASFSVFNLTEWPRISVGRVPEVVEIHPLERPREIAVRLPAPERSESSGLVRTLAGIWAAGTLLLLVRLAMQTVLLQRRLRLDPPRALDQPEIRDLLNRCREALGVRMNIAVATTPAVTSPSLLGVFRPSLLLPPGVVQTFSIDQLRFVFLHELAHLRRSDVLVNWFAAVVHALHWWNPLVWIAVSRLDEERELACDALALEHLWDHERAPYGDTVLQLLDQLQTPRLVPGLVGMTADKHQLKRRILMIANFRPATRRATWFGAVVAALALVTLTDATAGERKMFRRMLTPESKALMEKLDQSYSAEFRNVSFESIIYAAAAASGVTLNVAEGAIDDAARAARFDLKAKNVPAHIVINETLASVGLSLDFRPEGATVVKPEAGTFERRLARADLPGDGEDVIIIRKERSHGGLPAPEVSVEHGKARQIEVDVKQQNGVMSRKVTFRGTDEGQTEGTLEIEVRGMSGSESP